MPVISMLYKKTTIIYGGHFIEEEARNNPNV